jgi:hypothetical protein
MDRITLALQDLIEEHSDKDVTLFKELFWRLDMYNGYTDQEINELVEERRN